MKILNNNFVKRIITVLCLIMILTSFLLTPSVKAASAKTKMKDGEFYYSGTEKGAYVVTEGIFDWLLNFIADIADFLLGLFTMGGRMVFVGWTALAEMFLTWLLEATTGVSMDASSINATDLEANTDSSKNVTLEAIVYNQVPIFDISLFNFEERKYQCKTGTGQLFVECDACSASTSATFGDKLCRMEECTTCSTCLQQMADAGYYEKDASGNVKIENGKPVRTANLITVVKENVAMWYYVIRLIAMAGMLLVLIVIGIKMALTSVAQQRAIYKRMLWDWVVGLILLFTMQYIMIFCISFNNTLVDLLKNLETGVTEITKKEFNITTDKIKKTNQELELSVYEAVRTRAYDAKLINGTSGMIMYMTLVFMAYKYSVIYFKRYFTVIILTLMAPGVAFGYALQKVLTGKGGSFSNWLGEYFLTVSIQFVHALIYTSFVSVALVLSLNSISGMIVAFVIMHYMSKAESLFKKIFKFRGTEGSISGEASKSTNPTQVYKQAKAALGFMQAKDVLKMAPTPLKKAINLPKDVLLSPVKAAGTGAVLAASKIHEKRENSSAEAAEYAQKNEQLENIMQNLKNTRNDLSGKAEKDFSGYFKEYDTEKDVIDLQGQDAIEKELASQEKAAYEKYMNGNEEESAKAKKIMEELQNQREIFDSATSLSTKDVIKGHIGELLDKKKYYDYDLSGVTTARVESIMDSKYGNHVQQLNETNAAFLERKREAEKIAEKQFGKRHLKYTPFIGNLEYDSTQGKYVRKTLNDLVAEQFKSKNLLGFTDADKKLWKEATGFVKGTAIGLGSLFVGMGTIVENPGIGFGLLANGVRSRIEFYDKLGYGSRNLQLSYDDKSRRYTFNRFSKGAKKTIMSVAIQTAEGEKRKTVVRNVEKKHRKLYEALKLGGMGIAVAGAVGMAPAAGTIVAATGGMMYTVGSIKAASTRYSNSRNSLMGRMNAQHFKQYDSLKKKAIKDSITLDSGESEIIYKKSYEKLMAVLAATEGLYDSQEQIDQIDASEIEFEDAIQTEDGNVILIDGPKVKQKTKVKQQIIQEAVAEVIIKRAMESSSALPSTTNAGDVKKEEKALFGDASSIEEAKKIIEHKLKQQGTEIDKKGLDDLTSEIISASEIVLREENSRQKSSARTTDGGSVDISGLDGNPSRNTSGGNESVSSQGLFGGSENQTDSSASSKSGGKTSTSTIKVTALEQALVKEVIKEQIKTKQHGDPRIKTASDLSVEEIQRAVEQKKQQLFHTDATANVVDKINAGMEGSTGNSDRPSNLFGTKDGSSSVDSGKDGSSQVDTSRDGTRAFRPQTSKRSEQQERLLEVLANPTQTGLPASERDYDLTTQNSDVMNAYISQTISEIRQASVRSVAPKKESDRRKEKMRRIEALNDILMSAAYSDDEYIQSEAVSSIVTTEKSKAEDAKHQTLEDIIKTSTPDNKPKTPEENAPKKTVDDVLSELFQNTQEYELANDMLVAVKSMRRLNQRAELMKMKSSDSSYKAAKKAEAKKKAKEAFPDIQTSDADEQSDLRDKEAYGPVTDIIKLIRTTPSETSSSKEVKKSRSRRK